MISNGMSLLEKISSPSSPSHSPPPPPPPIPPSQSTSSNNNNHHQQHLDLDAGKFIKPNFSSILLSSSSSSSPSSSTSSLSPSSFGVEAALVSHVTMSAQNAVANNFLNNFRAAQQHASSDPTFGQCFQLLLQTQQQQQQQQTLNCKIY
jgi:hypothetical protein